jgi:predicted TPR repeat methyltransferase
MNIYLREFVKNKFASPGSALDLGAGQNFDVACLRELGWRAEGVDIQTGTDLNDPYSSPNAPHDLIVSNYVIHKLTNPEQLIATAFNNLKTEGWLFLHTFDDCDENSLSTLTADKTKAMLEKAGFRQVTVRTIRFYDNEPHHEHWHIILELTSQK